MIEHLRSFFGYCSHCTMPAFVGEFRLKGWKHTFCICESCIKKAMLIPATLTTEEVK